METPASRRDRIKRLAQKRTNEVIKKLEILGHCGNRQSYEYSDEEVKQIFLALEKKLNEVKGKFKPREDEAFHF